MSPDRHVSADETPTTTPTIARSIYVGATLVALGVPQITALSSPTRSIGPYDRAMLLALALLLVAPEVASPDLEACGLEDPGRAALAPAVGARRNAATKAATTSSRAFMVRGEGSAAGPVEGVLSGKTVYLSAGHGLTWTAAGWRTQRGNTNGIVEDLVSIEAVDQYLVPYLHAMGAYVVTVREPDLRSERVIVDDGQATLQGAPTEGPADTGWGEVALPITSDSTYPFEAGGARSLVASASETGGLVYAPAVPVTGYYNVYASWVQGPDRAADAHWVVRHSGGETHFRFDQRRHGSTWVLLGEFHFEAGAGPEAASVVVLDDSETPGATVSADAVRFGGGLGVHDRGGGESGRPMYEHCARYYAQWNGAPSSVFAWISPDGDADVSTRSRFAAWEHEAGEDAVYVAWHSNAPNPRQGTSTYSYGGSAPPGPLSGFSGAPGSRELQDFVHGEIVDDLRIAWNPDWVDEGRFTAYFGEVNPSHNDEMPSILVEVAYHDTPADADQLRDPRFRRIVARAMAQGIAKYFADADGTPLVLPPEPPSSVSVRNDGAGGLEVAWAAPEVAPGSGDPADAYVVQVSHNGYGFDDGAPVQGTSTTLEGLAPGDVRFVRVIATNAGGRSLPSQTVGAAVAASGDASVLVVGGFDRIDGGLLLPDDLSAFALGSVQRMWLRRINDGSYATRHGLSIAAAGFSFDGATDDTIEDGSVALDDYQAVDWFTGEDSTGDLPLPPVARDAIADYLDAGGRLLVSGAELAWALDENGMPEEQAFFRERLHAHYVGDDAETYDVSAVEGPLSGVASISFSDPASYDPRYPDILDAEPGAAVALVYDAAPGLGAAIAWGDGEPGERGVILGFPFETVADEASRDRLMAEVLAYFEVEETEGPDSGDTGGADDTAGAGSDDGEGDDDGPGSAGGTDATEDTEGPSADDAQDGGCACRTTPGSRSGPSQWLCAFLVWAVVRKRR